MRKNILLSLAGLSILLVGLYFFIKYRVTGQGVEGLYQIDHCYKDDKKQTIYLVTGTAKGRTFAKVLGKFYPNPHSDVEVVEEATTEEFATWHSDLNKDKVYPVKCP